MIKILYAAAFASALCSPALAQRIPGEKPHTDIGAAPVDLPSEAQVVGYINEVNQGELDLAQKALERSKNEEVLGFARQMIADHGENRAKLDGVGIEAGGGEYVHKLKQKHKGLDQRLAKLDGAAFDRAYIAGMVDGHAAVLDKLDKKLIPAAKTGSLAAHLQSTRPAVESHLEHARRIKASLGTR